MMEEEALDGSAMLLSLPADALPSALREWLAGLGTPATLASIELLADGSVLLQALPEVDPQFVARVRRTMAQYHDVLRRLT